MLKHGDLEYFKSGDEVVLMLNTNNGLIRIILTNMGQPLETCLIESILSNYPKLAHEETLNIFDVIKIMQKYVKSKGGK